MTALNKQTPQPANYWTTTARPMMMLAPMEDVTDTSFRQVVMENSDHESLHLLFTEFVSTDGLCHPVGFEKVSHRLMVSVGERALLKSKGIKLIAQIWGNDQDKFKKAVEKIEEHFDFDGYDINMGCPVKNVVAHGSCSALIDQPGKAAEIIRAVRASTNKPLSVKTRLGVRKIETERWIGQLLDTPVDAIVLHGRIQKQMSEGVANWDEIARAVVLKNQMRPEVKIIGNGDVTSLDMANQQVRQFDVDGVMVGRGIFKNPWLFNQNPVDPRPDQRINTLLRHARLYQQMWGTSRNFAILKRFLKSI